MIRFVTVSVIMLLPAHSLAAVVFQDSFDYVADRNVSNVETVFLGQGWTAVKANNATVNGGAGYLYTIQPPDWPSRVLVMESLPTTSSCSPWCQTDYYLQYGGENQPLGTIPANVWFQFWTYATPESRFAHQKFLYPCHTSYPCPATSYLWLLSFDSIDLLGTGDDYVQAPPGGRFFRMSCSACNYSGGGAPWNANKLYQNLSHTPMLVNTWYQVRVHIDISGPQGVYELWMRERGTSTWTKLAEWIGGVTPNFDWPIPAELRAGNKTLRMPTTVDLYNSTTYMDDFIMATSQEDLPDSNLGPRMRAVGGFRVQGGVRMP